MAQASIPVDLFNPGQVFACMGFLEAADVLLGHAEGGFDWAKESEARFEVRAGGTASPVDAVLEFLIKAQRERLAPEGYADPQPANNDANDSKSDGLLCLVAAFPAPEADRLALPLRFKRDGHELDVSHWCDESSRNSFKLFAGQQRSAAIASQMQAAMRELWENHQSDLLSDPLGLTVPLGGSSFKFDARKAWTAIDAGYSPDEQSQRVEASPVVEMLAAIGLEHARPDEFETREVRYGAWTGLLPAALARPALGGARVGVPIRIFRFTLDLAGKNKVVTFAQEETGT
jgi:CRISPR-associated protein Csx14